MMGRGGWLAGPEGPPAGPRRSVLRTLGRLLPRMALSGSASAILHPLMRVLADPTPYPEAPKMDKKAKDEDEENKPQAKSSRSLQMDALDTICCLAVPLGPDFTIFLPAIRKVPHNPPPSSSRSNHSGGSAQEIIRLRRGTPRSERSALALQGGRRYPNPKPYISQPFLWSTCGVAQSNVEGRWFIGFFDRVRDKP